MTYCYSYDGEDFTGECATRAEALEEAKDGKPGVEKVWTAECVPFAVNQFVPDADTIVDWLKDAMGDAAGAEAGEHADDYPDATGEAWDALGATLEAQIEEFVRTHVSVPTFYNVDAIEEHSVG